MRSNLYFSSQCLHLIAS